jgi:glycosyltransferase involved in cell wall biosynthesis
LIRVLHLPPEKVSVVYEAAAAHFRPVTDCEQLASLRARYHLPETFLLYVGTFEPRKNLPRLLRAYSRARKAGCKHKLVMVGPAGWRLDGFAREVETLGLQSSVQRLPYVAAEDLAGIYSLATLFVYPSLYEGFGLPPLEAMACGVPVLTSDNSALGELYHGAAHQVNALDEEMLADSLVKISADAEQRAELSTRGLERAKCFSWERAAAETTAIYNRLLKPRLNGTQAS